MCLVVVANNLPLNPALSSKTLTLSRLKFCRFDETFLEKSWYWLHDPEIKKLTMTEDFSRETHQQWFAHLPNRTDYLIWGVSCNAQSIGAYGFKHITQQEAEYWGYIGERNYWGIGLGGEIIQRAFHQARGLGVRALYLVVPHDNVRAIRLYLKKGFTLESETDGILKMRVSLPDAHV